jgi:STE24 endopeptidase
MMNLNTISCTFVAVYLAQMLFALWMARLNSIHIRRFGNRVPEAFEGLVDSNKLAEMNAYTIESIRFGMVHKVVVDALLLCLILSGFVTFVGRMSASTQFHEVWAGTLFFVILGVVFFIVELPFDWYHTFLLEQKYGFNRSTLKLWIGDNLKGILLQLGFLILLIVPILWFIRLFPDSWWVWAFLVVVVVELCIIEIYPVLIAPLFNRFEPLKDERLAEEVKRLAEIADMKTSGIFQMDAGKRSSHSNAYFTGLGKTKRVVLFDTLLASHDRREILAVLAHEIGHYRLRHVLKSLVLSLAATLAGFYLVSLLLSWSPMYERLGIDPAQPYVVLFFIGIFLQRVGYFLKPAYTVWSRRFERQADLFAKRLLGTAEPMIGALKRLASDNLANLNPHPLYVWFNYSHPPIVERIGLMEREEDEGRRS